MATRTINKSAFVRSLGDIPAAEVIEKAKHQGFTLSPAHVYTIRAAAKRKGAGSVRVVRRRSPGRPPRSPSTDLRSRMDLLVETFVEKILGALRSASLDELVRR
jgi:hypothetical protein